MHILVIPSWYSSERKKVHGSFFTEQFKALKDSGIKVTVAYNEIWPITLLGKIKEKRGIHFNVEFGLNTYRYKDYNFLPKNPLMFKVFNRRIDKIYKKIVKEQGKIDIIHAHSCFWGGIAADYLARKYNIPLVITEHTSLKHSRYVRDSYKKYIFKAYDDCNALIAVGNGLKEELGSYTKNKVKVIHNLVDLDLFNLKDEKPNEMFTFFSLAYLEAGKGMELLIKTFAKAFKGKECRLKIGGDGGIKGTLEALAEDLGISGQVIFLGALEREEAAKEMGRCDAFVLASEYETFGVVYIEATASGKPIIATRNGGAEDIVTKTNGIIVENYNEKLLADALKEMKASIKNYDRTKIRKECEEKYSKEVIAEKIIKVYGEVL